MSVELDLWTDKVERFREEFQSFNDVKFDGMEIIASQGLDKRYALFYRLFGDSTYENLKFPAEGYYQLKNVFYTKEE